MNHSLKTMARDIIEVPESLKEGFAKRIAQRNEAREKAEQAFQEAQQIETRLGVYFEAVCEIYKAEPQRYVYDADKGHLRLSDEAKAADQSEILEPVVEELESNFE
jgi:hypothetical protein